MLIQRYNLIPQKSLYTEMKKIKKQDQSLLKSSVKAKPVKQLEIEKLFSTLVQS